MKLTKKVKELENKPLTKCTIEKIKFVLICPNCGKKLFIFKTPPFEGMHIVASLFKPYKKEIPKPIDNTAARCYYCNCELSFSNEFTVRE